MNKRATILISILLVFVIMSTAIRYQDKKAKNEFDLFYSTQLSGKIVRIDKYARASNFVLDNSPIEFAFYPYVDENLNNGEIFSYIAKPGDSIYKAAYSDTLFLIKKNRMYLYAFQKI